MGHLAGQLTTYISLHLLPSPYISLHLPTSRYISVGHLAGELAAGLREAQRRGPLAPRQDGT